jgi:hypothetical protein
MNDTIRDAAWWYWLLTAGFLAASLAGWSSGVSLAVFLCVVQILHFRRRSGSFTSFPVQVRLAYLGLLVTGLWTALHWIHVVQLIGTSARVLVGYCLLARVLSLASWNRTEPLSPVLVRRTFFSMRSAVAPCGAVLQRPS